MVCKDHSGIEAMNTEQQRRLGVIEGMLVELKAEQAKTQVEISKVSVKVGLIVTAILPIWNALSNAVATSLPKLIKAASLFPF